MIHSRGRVTKGSGRGREGVARRKGWETASGDSPMISRTRDFCASVYIHTRGNHALQPSAAADPGRQPVLSCFRRRLSSTLPPERRDGGSRRSIPPQLPLALTRGPAEGGSSAVAAAVTAVAAAVVVIIIAIVAVAAAVAAAVAVTAVSAAVSSAATVAAVTTAVTVAVAIAVADAVPANSQCSFAASLPPQPKTCEKVREEATDGKETYDGMKR